MAGRPDRIGLALNQQRYKVGDVVSVEIKAPAAGRGYLLVESDKALHRQLIDIPAEGGQSYIYSAARMERTQPIRLGIIDPTGSK